MGGEKVSRKPQGVEEIRERKENKRGGGKRVQKTP